MSFHVVIPARYASSRLPAKPLADIAGKPMVVRVVERALESRAASVVVATDHAQIADAVRAYGHAAVLTREDHPSGTDRIAEVAALSGWGPDDVVVNLQGDEPLVEPELIRRVAHELLLDAEASIATASHAITDAADFFNPNVVKVVCDSRCRALYFSRAPIPWARDAFALSREQLPAGLHPQRHVGLYAYRVGFLARYAELAPAPEERLESLEQLRALWHGYRIRVATNVSAPAPGVDTPEDLERVRAFFAARDNATSSA